MTTAQTTLEKLIDHCLEGGVFSRETAVDVNLDLVESGLIDSMGLLMLQSLIAESYGVEIPEAVFVAELRSLQRIASYLELQPRPSAAAQAQVTAHRPLLPELLDSAAGGDSRTPVWRFPKQQVELTLNDIVRLGDDYARALSALGVRPGSRVGFVLENGPEYPSLLLAVWRLGAVAVPLRSAGGHRFDMAGFLRDIDADCEFAVLVFEDDFDGSVIDSWASSSGRTGVQKGQLTTLAQEAPHVTFPPLCANDLAILQYSSGSTARPKGVIVTHAMVRDQVEQLDAEYRYACGGEGLRSSGSWLPFHHDMGLFIGILLPLFARADNVLASPLFYMRDPKRWFRLQATHRVDWNFTTNLAMANSLHSLRLIDPASIDLSHFHLYLAAEKVSSVVLQKTTAALVRLGLPRDNLRVGYGMAENALGVASTKDGPIRCVRVRTVGEAGLRFADLGDPEALEVVSVGRPHKNTVISIRDDAGVELPDFTIGEICVEGPCLTPGYYKDPEKTARHLVAGRLHTQDLGFRLDGELYFVARKDDVLVVGGRNIAPDDIEDCVEAMDQVPAGGAVLIDVSVAATGKTELVLLVEIAGRLSESEATLRRTSLQSHVLNQCGLLIHHVVFAKKNTLEKTSSGKKRRKLIRERFVRHELELT
jgi:fatty-acyl-CoA synthase